LKENPVCFEDKANVTGPEQRQRLIDIFINSVYDFYKVVKHPVSDGDFTPPEGIPPIEAGVLTHKTPTSNAVGVSGGMIKTLDNTSIFVRQSMFIRENNCYGNSLHVRRV